MKKLLLLLFISGIAFSQPVNSASITFVANSGFLLSGGGNSILIDALFNEGFGRYDPPSDSLIKLMVDKVHPFNSVDLYLVTHNHGDHFYAPLVSEFLKKHFEATLVSSNEVCDQVKDKNIPKKHVKGIALTVGEYADTVFNGIPLKIFRLKHTGDSTGMQITDFAYLIDLNGVKIFHPGDITFAWDKSLLEKFNLEKENIDVMFVPYFDLSESSAKYINEVVKPKNIVAIHIPPKEFKEASKKILEAYPGGIVFEKPLDTKIITN
jgi:L-ascorbate metabolism protein UlaG (beta-lactamase superfamily)